MSEAEQPVTRASDVAQYAYCARSWWLRRVRGFQPENVQQLAQGLEEHAGHGKAVAGYRLAARVGYALLGAALASGLLLLALLLRGEVP